VILGPSYVDTLRMQVRQLTIENARLKAELALAAAPDLLEALQKLEEASDDSDGCQYGTLSTSFVRDIARAAIAKAEGRS
jgi:ribosomal protein L11